MRSIFALTSRVTSEAIRSLAPLDRMRALFSASSSSPTESQITIDPTVINRLRQLQEKSSPDKSIALRIEVEGGGCSGFQYKFKLDNGPISLEDRVIEQDGCKLVCDTMSYEFLKGAKIEYEETMMRSSFVVAKNPNAEASCGCGSSFSPKTK